MEIAHHSVLDGDVTSHYSTRDRVTNSPLRNCERLVIGIAELPHPLNVDHSSSLRMLASNERVSEIDG